KGWRRTSRSASRTSAGASRLLALALSLGVLLAADARAARQPAPPARQPSGPTLFVPARPESVPPESDPAPLLVPGNSPGVDSLESERIAKAREQYSIGRTLEVAQPGSALLMYRNALRLDP